jgi:fatty acid desaturase
VQPTSTSNSVSTAKAPTAAGAPIPKRRDFLTRRHGALNVAHVLAAHALLVAWFWLGYRLLPFAVYVPLSLVVCVVHQRSMSEWIHEGAHLNIVPSRRWNDLVTNLLAGLWFALPVRVYRDIHFQHHRKDAFFVLDDPDTRFLDVESRPAFWRALLSDLTGLTMIRQFLRFQEKDLVPTGERRSRALTALVPVAVLVGAFAIGRLDAAVLYYASLATLYPLFNRLRTYAQHVAIDDLGRSRFEGSETSRTIEGGLLDRVVNTSPRLMYHHEHHAYPHLPYRALERLVVRGDDDVNRYTRSRWRLLRAVYRGLPG